MNEPKSYSISFRLRRTTVEDAFVSVPVNAEIMQPAPDTDGKFRLDTDKIAEVALRLGRESDTIWTVEGNPVLELHPIQMNPADRNGSGLVN